MSRSQLWIKAEKLSVTTTKSVLTVCKHSMQWFIFEEIIIQNVCVLPKPLFRCQRSDRALQGYDRMLRIWAFKLKIMNRFFFVFLNIEPRLQLPAFWTWNRVYEKYEQHRCVATVHIRYGQRYVLLFTSQTTRRKVLWTNCIVKRRVLGQGNICWLNVAYYEVSAAETPIPEVFNLRTLIGNQIETIIEWILNGEKLYGKTIVSTNCGWKN